MSLELKQVSGGYGQRKVIDNLTFQIESGEVMGLIGLNGAGKSTTMKHIMGLLQPFSGSIRINGKTLAEDGISYRQLLAYIPESPMLYRALTLREHLDMTALAYNIEPEVVLERARPLLEMFRLTEHLDWFPTDFSKGMKQKVMIICALVTEPSVLIIDEPFIGLDPLAIHDFMQLIQDGKARGTAVLMSTHVLMNAEKICDRFAILHQGQLQKVGTLADIQQAMGLIGSSLDEIYQQLLRGQVISNDA
ncbi:ABC transporter ATP-binding protein [Dolosigranulum savutiense]|uniref:ABC transporter ATP-binding protein n=1 Tax=Dolosigranulum savutiense TaxID=3110288 RepID=A0AB74TP79_9LACT